MIRGNAEGEPVNREARRGGAEGKSWEARKLGGYAAWREEKIALRPP